MNWLFERWQSHSAVPPPPGTLLLKDVSCSAEEIMVRPTPTINPEDPLNWALWRKALNMVLACLYVFMTFVQLDIGFSAWQQYQAELSVSVSLLNAAAAVNYAGLAIGCFLLVPLVHKFGRRPLYILSTVMQLAACIWSAVTHTKGDMIGSNLISGLGGAISETIGQITVADLFFTHQHAVMNGWYVFASAAGAYLGPVASGYIIDSQGWRWAWWWCSIFSGVNLLLICLFLEETKYCSTPNYTPGAVVQVHESDGREAELENGLHHSLSTVKMLPSTSKIRSTISSPSYETEEGSYWHRHRLLTKTEEPMLHYFYEPMIALFKLPAIAYTAITYGSLLACFAILTSVQATYLFSPPYNFTAKGIGLMNLAPFIGSIPGIFLGGYVNDKSIVWLSGRNNGVYEPEMRLLLSLPAAFVPPAGILLVGLGIYNGLAWPVLAIGLGIFGFGLAYCSNIALSYAMDSYTDVIGTALVGVVLIRNALAVVVLFCLTPWVTGMGLVKMHTLVAALSFAILLLPIPFLLWGKKIRLVSASTYRDIARRQPTNRGM